MPSTLMAASVRASHGTADNPNMNANPVQTLRHNDIKFTLASQDMKTLDQGSEPPIQRQLKVPVEMHGAVQRELQR